MVMTVHKLTAGSGYDYLTRQVAALDATDKGHSGLAAYYEAKGEAPGRWVGSGMVGIAGLEIGDGVTSEQMFNLFGLGVHPLDQTMAAAYDTRMTGTGRLGNPRDRDRTGWLGKPFAVHHHDASPLQIEVARRVTDTERAAVDGPVAASERALIRTQVAHEFFETEHGRAPAGEQELASYVAEQTRPKTTAVAGYDLTFSPVKSVSALWALADAAVAQAVEAAHDAAVGDALRFIEEHALFTRTGAGGIRQVPVAGLVAAAFTHRDSRAGDPDLHTHVAVANKVQTVPTTEATVRQSSAGDGQRLQPGRWLSIDGRVLFKAVVAASETYNTRLEHHLTRTLGVRFAERPAPGDHLRGAKRSVREIVGIDPDLLSRWSTRRRDVVDRQTDLAADFRATHGRPPTAVEALHLAQQANLETREPKHTARSEAEQRATWRSQAWNVLGGPEHAQRMLDRAFTPPPTAHFVVDDAWFDRTARRVINELEQRRATWQTWHVRAEAERQIRHANITTRAPDVDGLGELADRLVDTALQAHSVSLAGPADTDFDIAPHPALRRQDGASVYAVHGSRQFTSPRILAAEHRLLAHAAEAGAPTVPAHHLEMAVLEAAANGTPLNPGQTALVHDMATSGRRVQLAIAPAGTGKTTALRALTTAWTDAGGTVLALAPSAAAAAAFADALNPGHGATGSSGVVVETLAKLTHTLDTREKQLPDWVADIGAHTLLIIDEAGMADTPTLDHAIDHACRNGATVRLLGDDQQLAAIGAGGILRDINYRHGALHLDQLMRFANPHEADATLLLRDGNPDAVDFYLDHHRIHIGDELSILSDVLTAWHHDRQQGLDALMLAPTRDQVRELNHRAQQRLHHHTTGLDTDQERPATLLADGLTAGIGDLVITRTNDRRLRLSATDWVTNGDRWHITAINPDGSLDVTHTHHALHARLPRSYVVASVELGYATTTHTAQGVTADIVHGLITGSETRQDLYTMLTRGRHHNHAYLPTAATTGDPHQLIHPEATAPLTTRETLERILANDGAATSATTTLRTAHDPATLYAQARDRYTDALIHACEHVVGRAAITAIATHAEHLVPGITDQPAWPTLLQHLTHAAADNHDPIALLTQAARRGQLRTAHDPAATLTWRLEALTDNRRDHASPLPARVSQAPAWANYLQRRQQAVADAQHVLARSDTEMLPLTPSTQASEASVSHKRVRQAENHPSALTKRPPWTR